MHFEEWKGWHAAGEVPAPHPKLQNHSAADSGNDTVFLPPVFLCGQASESARTASVSLLHYVKGTKNKWCHLVRKWELYWKGWSCYFEKKKKRSETHLFDVLHALGGSIAIWGRLTLCMEALAMLAKSYGKMSDPTVTRHKDYRCKVERSIWVVPLK